MECLASRLHLKNILLRLTCILMSARGLQLRDTEHQKTLLLEHFGSKGAVRIIRLINLTFGLGTT